MEQVKSIVWAINANGQPFGFGRIVVEKKIGNRIIEEKEFPIPEGCLGIIGKKTYEQYEQSYEQ